jgi:hypothetical protein
MINFFGEGGGLNEERDASNGYVEAIQHFSSIRIRVHKKIYEDKLF